MAQQKAPAVLHVPPARSARPPSAGSSLRKAQPQRGNVRCEPMAAACQDLGDLRPCSSLNMLDFYTKISPLNLDLSKILQILPVQLGCQSLASLFSLHLLYLDFLFKEEISTRWSSQLVGDSMPRCLRNKVLSGHCSA